MAHTSNMHHQTVWIAAATNTTLMQLAMHAAAAFTGLLALL